MSEQGRSGEERGFETRTSHPVEGEDPYRALTPPLYMTSTYTFPSMEEFDRFAKGETGGFVYSRAGNPTVRSLEQSVASLEGAESGCAFASGMGAIAAVLFSIAKKKKSLVFSRHLYSGTRRFIESMLLPLGCSVHFMDFRKVDWPDSLDRLLSVGAGGLFLETPSNPTLDIIDLAMAGEISRRHGVSMVVDNTFASPALQNPLSLGADIVIHSATKYLGGHGDLLGGVAVGGKEKIGSLLSEEGPLLGATLSPMNAWLILRGMKTLKLRMDAHSHRALALANVLSSHPGIRRVFYPGLPDHPNHEIALRQMKGMGGMLSILFPSGASARTFLDGLRLVRIGVSLGDPASLVEHPASMSHRSWPRGEREAMGIEDGLVRMSVGLESLPDLLEDVERSLQGT